MDKRCSTAGNWPGRSAPFATNVFTIFSCKSKQVRRNGNRKSPVGIGYAESSFAGSLSARVKQARG